MTWSSWSSLRATSGLGTSLPVLQRDGWLGDTPRIWASLVTPPTVSMRNWVRSAESQALDPLRDLASAGAGPLRRRGPRGLVLDSALVAMNPLDDPQRTCCAQRSHGALDATASSREPV